MSGTCEAVAAVARVTAAVADLAAASVSELEEPESSRVHAALRKAQDVLGLVAARVLAQVEADGRWATSPTGRGARDFDDWLTKETGGSRAGARRQTRLARAVKEESVPGLADAVAAGSVTMEHADALTRLGPTTPARRAALAGPDPSRNASRLLRRAAELGLDDFTSMLKRWAATVDPTADEKGHRDATARVSCTLSTRDDGVALNAFMTAVDGAAFEAALVAVAGVPSAGDDRTHSQRTGAALGEMARLVLDQGLAATRSGGFRPHLTIQVSYETLLAQVRAVQAADATAAGADDDDAGKDGRGERRASTGGEAFYPSIPAGFDPATLSDGTPIPASVLARLACDAEVSRVVFGPASQVLDVGRDERLYTGAMRRAVIARDQHCAYPGCDRPPRFGEVHHVRHWVEHRGVTSVENGVLLCWHHHDVAHSQHLVIHRDHVRTRWEFHRHDGTPIPHRGPPAAPGSERRDPEASPALGVPGRGRSPSPGFANLDGATSPALWGN